MSVNKLSRALLGIMCARGFDGGSVPSGQLQVGVEVSRTMRVELAGEGEARAYAATLSSEAPAMQWFGREILLHTPEAINLERAQGNGLVLLWNHCTDQPIGRAQGVKLVDAKLRATSLVFSGRAQAQEVKADVDAGLLGDMSIRYTIDDYDEVISPVDGELTIIVKRWTPLEASIVPIPADPSVGVGRSAQRNAGGTGSGDGSINIDEFKAQRLAAERSGITIGAQRERERATQEGLKALSTFDERLRRQSRDVLDQLDRFRAVGVGPGLGTDEAVAEGLRVYEHSEADR